MQQEQIDIIEQVATGGAMATITGIAHYLQRVRAGQKFNWADLLLQIFTSALCGLMVGGVAIDWGYSPLFSSCLCGMAGYIGTALLDTAEARILKEISGKSHKPKKKVATDD